MLSGTGFICQPGSVRLLELLRRKGVLSVQPMICNQLINRLNQHSILGCVVLTVLCRLVQVELSALGIGTAYMQERVDELGDEVWRGVKNKYWHFPVYFLPVCRKIAGWQSPATAQLTADEGDEAEEEEEQQP